MCYFYWRCKYNGGKIIEILVWMEVVVLSILLLLRIYSEKIVICMKNIFDEVVNFY